MLDLARPIYQKTSYFGHFGREERRKSFPWEKLDKVEEIKVILKNIYNYYGRKVCHKLSKEKFNIIKEKFFQN